MKWFRSAVGLTLVEVMVTAAIAVLTLLAFLGTILKAYEMSASCRYRDQARAVLQSYADEFERLKVVTEVGTPIPVKTVVPFFQVSGETSNNLSWNGVSGTDITPLRVPLGGDPSSPMVTLTRRVSDVGEFDGKYNTDNTTVTAA